MQQSQLHATQTKIRELCAQYSSLQERFFMEGRHADAEARHADAAEGEIRMLKTVYKMSGSHHRRRRRRDSSSDCDIGYSKKCPSHQYNSSQSQSYSSPALHQASSSKHTPYDDEGMLVRMTPKKNKYGQVASVEVTPA
ncbi:hypothetical protein BYT27DRAFT_7253149 [Phlegmacium glaucopus]|nr:hypothetical protein BYT27DRAFT_7253149 [Phlegmacium glaucopus]